MKKIILIIVSIFMSVLSFGQNIKEINRSMTVKPVSCFWDEKGQVVTVNPEKTFVHLEIKNFGEGNNLVIYWIEQNGEVFHKHITEHVTVLMMTLSDGDKCYSVRDEDFIHMQIIMLHNGENGANFQLKEKSTLT